MYRCTGSETSLANCLSTEQTKLQAEVTTYCNAHTGDVGVECNIPQTCHSKEESVSYKIALYNYIH